MRRTLCALAIVALAVACASAPAPSSPNVVRLVLADDWASAPTVERAIERFEREHGDVRVRVQSSPFSQIPDIVGSAVDLGQPPDLAHWHAFAAASAGLAQSVDDLWDEAGLRSADFLPGAVEDVTWTGERYGVPLDVNALVLLANEQALEQAGLTTSELGTPADFRRAAAGIVDAGVAPHAVTVTASSWAAYGWIVANQGELVTVGGDGRPEFSFDDPATVEALERLADLVREGDAPAPFAPDLSLDAVAAFTTGDVVFHASGSWDLPVTRRARQGATERVQEVAVLPLPQADPGDPRTVLGGSSLFVPKGAEERELAFDLMLALIEDDVALELAMEEGRLPVRTRVYEDPAFSSSPDLVAFVEQLDTAEVMPLIAYPDVAGAFADALQSVLSLRTPPSEAMRDLQAFAEDLHMDG